MVATCHNTSDEIVRLTDRALEQSHPLQAVLEIIVAIDRNDSKLFTEYIQDNLCPSIVSLALKYEMKSVVAEIKMFLFSLIAQWPPKGGEFVLEAAQLGEWSLCGRLVASLNIARRDEEYEVKEMRRMLDWRGWTPDIMDELGRVGARFSWAVCYAGTHHSGQNKHQRISYESLGQELARLMTS